MRGDALLPVVGAPWHRHVNLSLSLATDSPKRGGASMAEDGALPAAENGGHPLTRPSHLWASDGVDARSSRMEPTGQDPVPNRVPGVAELDQLLTGHMPVLEPREPPHT